jgi:Fe-S-cluster containining protein
MAKRLTLLVLMCLQSAAALADEAAYTVKMYASFMALKADTAKSCELISHDCEICTIAPDKTFACSSVGMACEPKEWRCYEKKPAPH